MIEYLRIRNLALIADMELEFTSGLNALTGETGAGKSFILKAINFILGERLGADMVRPGKKKAQVEALFSLPDEGELVLRRELSAETGRSRLYVNDVLRSQESIRALRPRLIMHTSQHGQQRLALPAHQLALVNTWMRKPELLEKKEALLHVVRAAREKKAALLARSRELSEKRDFLEMQLREIRKVNPQAGEEEELEQQRLVIKASSQRLKHYERILGFLEGEEYPGILTLFGQLEQELEELVLVDPAIACHLEDIAGSRAMLSDFSHEIRRHSQVGNAVADPDAIEARLYALSQLKRKLHRTLPEIFSLRDEISANLSFLDACTLDIKQAEREEARATKAFKAILEEVNTARHHAAKAFCLALEKELSGLGFAQEVRVIPEFVPHEWFPECVEDRVRLLWAPNPGQHPQPLDRIASGGELSRFLLAVVSLQVMEEATLIFDEVDAGVGGVTLNRVAERLTNLAGQRQILLITHWPQLASRAINHFQVSKTIMNGETFTRCKLLDDKARQAELQRMSGIEI